mgnify:CR=1 FL=1
MNRIINKFFVYESFKNYVGIKRFRRGGRSCTNFLLSVRHFLLTLFILRHFPSYLHHSFNVVSLLRIYSNKKKKFRESNTRIDYDFVIIVFVRYRKTHSLKKNNKKLSSGFGKVIFPSFPFLLLLLRFPDYSFV